MGQSAPSSTTGDLYNTISPVRVADTRCATLPTPGFCASENLPAANSALQPPSGGQTIDVATGLPSSATAADLDVIDVQPTYPNYLTVFPTGTSMPVVSTVNWVPTDTFNIVPNGAYATLGTAGDVSIFNGGLTGHTNVIVDLFGYFTPTS